MVTGGAHADHEAVAKACTVTAGAHVFPGRAQRIRVPIWSMDGRDDRKAFRKRRPVTQLQAGVTEPKGICHSEIRTVCMRLPRRSAIRAYVERSAAVEKFADWRRGPCLPGGLSRGSVAVGYTMDGCGRRGGDITRQEAGMGAEKAWKRIVGGKEGRVQQIHTYMGCLAQTSAHHRSSRG